ncbi:2Fe-2S iron-sulfur cluster-binding protein [Granulicoccus phenolivorans]|uniref:2Fe-2S iron-sulfur cluster-binding protein n=1 Tax=Granulicoccus phenolivorans TaxID=266854 RepID=UPI00042251A2|nr:2Fe-2S iron-sulfur cluster-binding protein [Granulicoccus phenolivorans]
MPKLTVEPTGIEVPAAEDDTIMAALNKSGYTYLFGCKRGGCGICKIEIVEGEIEHNRPVAETALSTEERERGICLGCRAVPKTDIVARLTESSIRVTSPLLHPQNLPKKTKKSSQAKVA